MKNIFFAMCCMAYIQLTMLHGASSSAGGVLENQHVVVSSSSSSSSTLKISDRLRELLRQEQDTALAHCIDEFPDIDQLFYEIAQDFAAIARAEGAGAFLYQLLKYNPKKFKIIRRQVTQKFITLIPKALSGSKSAAEEAVGFLRTSVLDWRKLSEVYATVLSLMEYDITLFHCNALKDMLIHAPEGMRERVVTQVLRSYNNKFESNYPGQTDLLVQLVADIIVLYDVNTDVCFHGRDEDFSRDVLMYVRILQKAYGYCHERALLSQETPLRSWICEQLQDEQKCVIEQIEHEGQTDLSYEFGCVVQRRAKKIDAPEILEQKKEDSFFQRKLSKMVLFPWISMKRPVYSETGAAMGTYYPRGANSLEFPYHTFYDHTPLEINFILAHEMMHYYFDDGFFMGLVKDNVRKALKLSPKRQFVIPPLRILGEKRADLLAGLHAGPDACRAFASYVDSMASIEGDCHLDGAMRAAALRELADMMDDEKAGKPFVVPDVRSAELAAWLAAKGVHPARQEDFRRVRTVTRSLAPRS